MPIIPEKWRIYLRLIFSPQAIELELLCLSINNLALLVNELRQAIEKETELMSGKYDALKAAVSRNTSVIESAAEAFKGIAAKLAAADDAGDAAELTALIQELNTESDTLAASVVTGTAVAPPAVAEGGSDASASSPSSTPAGAPPNPADGVPVDTAPLEEAKASESGAPEGSTESAAETQTEADSSKVE